MKQNEIFIIKKYYFLVLVPLLKYNLVLDYMVSIGYFDSFLVLSNMSLIRLQRP